MRVKSGVTVLPFDDDYVIIDTDSDTAGSRFMVRTNETGARIIQLLSGNGCDSEPQLIEALCYEYDAPEEVIAKSVRYVLQTLRDVGFLSDT